MLSILALPMREQYFQAPRSKLHWYSPGRHQSGKGCSSTRKPTKCDLGFGKLMQPDLIMRISQALAFGMQVLEWYWEAPAKETCLFGLPKKEWTEVTIGAGFYVQNSRFHDFPHNVRINPYQCYILHLIHNYLDRCWTVIIIMRWIQMTLTLTMLASIWLLQQARKTTMWTLNNAN